MITGYTQSSKAEELKDFIDRQLEANPDACFEVTVHGAELPKTNEKATVLIDGEAVYHLDFGARMYTINDSLFYLSKKESLDACMYLHTLQCSITPHWLPYALRNIMRHGDPFRKLRESLCKGSKVEVIFE